MFFHKEFFSLFAIYEKFYQKGDVLEVLLQEDFLADYFYNISTQLGILILVLPNDFEFRHDELIDIPSAINATFNCHRHPNANSAFQDNEEAVAFLAEVAQIFSLFKD